MNVIYLFNLKKKKKENTQVKKVKRKEFTVV